MVKLKKIVLFLSFIMVFGIIVSFIPSNYVEAAGNDEMVIMTAPKTVELGKVWRVKFNKGLKEEDLIDNESIYVVDSEGEIHKTTLSLEQGNNKIVLVTPDSDYENYKPYTLYIQKGLQNDEDVEVIDQVVKMDFMVEAKIDKTIDTSKHEGNKVVLKDETIYGDLIITGGGQVTLRKVEVKGNIIVEDVSENSLILDNVKANKLEVNDDNGARIVVHQPKQKGDKEEFSILNSIDINKESSSPITLEGDFSSTTVNVDAAVEIKVAKNTSIEKVEMKNTEAKITSNDETIDIAASIGTISGEVSAELEAMKAEIILNGEKLAKLIDDLNKIPKDSNEDYAIYLDRGRQTKAALEELLGDKVGQDYRNYTEHIQIRTANTVRAFMENRKFTTINQVESAFTNAKEWNKVFGEGMKYAAYHDYMSIDEHYQWPVINSDTKIGDDIKDIVLRLAKDVTAEQLNKDITVTILHEDDWNSGLYLDIDAEKQEIHLARLNKSNRPVNISIMFEIRDSISGMNSTTNFIVTLEPQVNNMGEVELTSTNSEIVSWIDNQEQWLNTYDNITVGELLGAIESTDEINIVDLQDNVITDMDMYTENFMKLEVRRGDDRAYYTISADPVLSFNGLDIIKKLSGRMLEVYPGKTVENVINSIIKKHDYYKLAITDKSNEEYASNVIVENGMYLWIDTGNGRYGFEISVYIGVINLSKKYSPIIDDIIDSIDKIYKAVYTFNNVTVGDFLKGIASDSEKDTLDVVDQYNKSIENRTDLVSNFMKLEISRGENKSYYRISATPIIETNNKDVIKGILDTRNILVAPGSTGKMVINAVTTEYGEYTITIGDSNWNLLDDGVTVTDGMMLLFDDGDGRSGYRISIDVGEVDLTIRKRSIVNYIGHGDKYVYTYDNVIVEDLLNALGVIDSEDTLAIVDQENELINGDSIVTNSMRLEISRGKEKLYYGIRAWPILNINKENNNSVIKEIPNNWSIIVFPDKKGSEVIAAIEARNREYTMYIEDANWNLVDNDIMVTDGMKLLVKDVDNNGFGYQIIIYSEDSQP